MRVKGLDAKHDEQEKGDGDAGLHGEHVGAQRVRQVAAEEGDGGAEQREDQHPQQHGAFVVPPHAGDLVEQRLGRMRIGPHVLDREVGRDVGVGERAEGDGEQRELGERGGLGDLHQAGIAGVRAPGGQHHLHQRHGEGQHDGEMSEFDDHGACARRIRSPRAYAVSRHGDGVRGGGNPRRPTFCRSPPPWPSPHKGGARTMGSATRDHDTRQRRHFGTAPWPCRRLPDALLLEGLGDFGGHVVLVVLGEHASARKRPAGSSLPSATTPWPSRKRSGRMPV